MSDDELADALRAAAESAAETAIETLAIGERLGLFPPDDNPRPRTLGAALLAFDGSQRALRKAMGELRHAHEARSRAVRHALRYRAAARKWKARDALWGREARASRRSWNDLTNRQAARIAALEAAIDRALAAGEDWRRALEGVRHG